MLAMAALVLAAGFSACDTGGGGTSPPTGVGAVTVSLDVPGVPASQSLRTGIARTVYPGAGFESDGVSYTLSFVAMTNGEAHADVPITAGETSKTVSDLVVGTYTITVTASKTIGGASTAIAEGSATGVVVTANGSTPASVTLKPKTGGSVKGSFAYDITTPTGVGGTLSIKQSGTLVGEAITLNTGARTTATKNDLEAGIYEVFVQLTGANAPPGFVESLHIYAGLTSTLTKTYGGE
jgi:hypothetical protein